MSRCGSNGWLVEEESLEGLAWGEEAQRLAWSFVEFFGDGGEVGLVGGDDLSFG
jgi:hypothetical protein